jgi:DNA sulfur modification protein DndD
MIINKVALKNFQCYYGYTEIVFSKDLNILLGANGEGKTKLFEAIMWVLDMLNKNQEHSVASAKAISELEVGQSGMTSVALHITREAGDRENFTIIKERAFFKKPDGDIHYSEVEFKAVHETLTGERNFISDGKSTLNNLFPYEYRQYSNFEGEDALDIFDTSGGGDDSLVNLINLFSNAEKNEKYGKIFEEVYLKAKEAEEKAAKNNSKIEREYKALLSERDSKNTAIGHKKELLTGIQLELANLSNRISSFEKIVDNNEEFNTLNEKIKSREEKIKKLSLNIKTGYVDFLFDRKWILIHFREVLDGFNKKYDSLEKNRRDAERAHIQKQAAAKALAAASHDFTALAVNVPDRATMQEMLDEEVCKVCSRRAEKGSEAYEFMKSKLEALIKDIEQSEEDIPELFKFNYLAELRNERVIFEERVTSDIDSTTDDIKRQFKINTSTESEILRLQEEIDDLIAKKSELVGSKGKTEDSYTSILADYITWVKQRSVKEDYLKLYTSDIDNIKSDMRDLETKIEKINTASGNEFLSHSKKILFSLSKVFEKVKNEEYDWILKDLENRANKIFGDINVESFQGTIKIERYRLYSGKYSVRVEHVLHNGERFMSPNKSLKTSVNIAIIMAISDMAKSKEGDRINSYPLIFDAPVSSFDKNKSSQFLNMLKSISGQKIIMLKDFVSMENGIVSVVEDFKNLSCDSSFLISLKRPFIKEDLATIETQVRKL